MMAAAMTAGANPFYNKSIVLHYHDSRQTAITIEDGMSTTFADGHLVLTHAKDGATYEIRQPLSEIARWTFSDSEGNSDLWATAGIADAGCRAEIRLDGNRLHVIGAKGDAPVKIYTAGGILAASGKGECSFDLSTLSPGIYLLSVSEKTFKIAVK